MRYKRPDKKNALSLIDAAKKRMDYTLTLEINDDSSSTIVQNIHESFRMLGDAILINKGIDPTTHIDSISEIIKLPIKASRPLQVIDNIRTLRRNVNYYGYIPSKLEAEDVVSIAKEIFPKACTIIKKQLAADK
jgi:uncharacterized protein (UPF0332 family)